MTREEQIREASIAYTKANCPRAIGGDYFRDRVNPFNINHDFIEGAMFADANQPSPWISVEDRLPEPEKNVIILDKRKHIDIDFLTDDGEDGYYWWKSDDTIWCDDDKITHWMPIPELPKEE